MMTFADWLTGQDALGGQTRVIVAACRDMDSTTASLEDQLDESYRNGVRNGQLAAASEYATALAREREDLHRAAGEERRLWLECEAASTLASVDKKLECLTGVIEQRLATILVEFLAARIAAQAVSEFHATLEEHLRQRKPEIVRLSAPAKFHASLRALMQPEERPIDIFAPDSLELLAESPGGGFETAIGRWLAGLREAADE